MREKIVMPTADSHGCASRTGADSLRKPKVLLSAEYGSVLLYGTRSWHAFRVRHLAGVILGSTPRRFRHLSPMISLCIPAAFRFCLRFWTVLIVEHFGAYRRSNHG